MLTVMLGGDLDVATWVELRVRIGVRGQAWIWGLGVANARHGLWWGGSGHIYGSLRVRSRDLAPSLRWSRACRGLPLGLRLRVSTG